MHDICRVYAANSENSFMELDLPATDYEMLDMMERLHLEDGKLPYLEVLKFREEYDYLEKCVHEQPDIYQLNALARKLSEFTSVQEMAAFEGLVGKEIGNRAVTIELPRLINFAYSTDCCHVAEDAMTDFQLGKFLVENDFIEEANNLPGSMLALLDYGKIGREHREQEGGVYTGFGYVEQHTDVRHVSETMDYRPHKPDYTILLNVLPVPLIPGEKRDPIPVELPASSEQLQATLEKAGCASWSNVMTAILDSPLPAWNRRIFMDDEVPQVIQLAEKLRQLDADGKLTKYKAILSATDCQEVADAVALSKTVDEYMLLPEVRTLEEAAVDDLRISIDPITMGRLQPYIDLRGYGVAMLEYHNAKLTSYGRLDRDGEPIQLVRDEPQQSGMEMMQ